MSLTKARELREDRTRLWKEADAILKAAEKESRALTDEENATVDKIHSDIEEKRLEVERLEKHARLDSELQDATLREKEEERTRSRIGAEDIPPGGAVTGDPEAPTYSEVFEKYFRDGMDFLSYEERMVLRSGYVQAKGPAANESRQQSSGTTTTGGFTVPDAPMGALVDKMKAFGGMRAAPTRQFTSESGAPLPIPVTDRTSQVGGILGENTEETTTTNITFTQVVLGAFKYSSRFVKASIEFLQDTSLNAGEFITDALAERIARILNQHFTTGTGSGQPLGVDSAALIGATAASATAIAFSDVINLKHAVDPAYRGPNSGFMFNDATLALLKKTTVSSGDARSIWQPGFAVDAPDTIDGSRYWINQDMASVAAGAHSMLYGDWSKYYIRDVMPIAVVRDASRYLEYAQVAFIAFSRHDGDLVDTSAIKYLRHPAS